MKKVGIVGLGIMGKGMANNFLDKGYRVFVWNRNKKVAQPFQAKGAIVCESPADVAQRADVVFEVTANDESSREVWLGKHGILEGASNEKVLITCATLSIGWIDELITTCQKRNFTFFDMALTGGRIGAETGALTLLCGGDEKVLEGLRETLQAIATKVLYFGKAGQGMRYKLILNFLQATHIVALGQALKIAKTHDMDLKKVGDALAERPGGVITQLAWRDYQKEPEPINFSIEWITKDLEYARKFAQDLDITLLEVVLQQYRKAVNNGFGSKDWARISQIEAGK